MFYEEVQQMSKISFLTRESEIHIFKSLCNSLFIIERFSFECRKVIGFAFITLSDWLKRFAPLFHPIRNKTKTNCDALACIFPGLCVSYM